MIERRNERRKEKDNRPVLGNVKFYVQSDEAKTEVYNKIDRAKLLLNSKISNVTNTELLNQVLDLFLRTYEDKTQKDNTESINFRQYLHCEKDSTQEAIYFITESAIRNMSAGIQLHGKECGKPIDVREVQRSGHAAKLTFMCEDKHTFKCDTSPHIEGGKYLVNLTMLHSLLGSGLRYTQYERIGNAANFGVCPVSYFENVHDIYCDVTSQVTKECIKDATNDEVAQTLLQTEDSEYEGINILNDARHGWRKNAAQSYIIALGCMTHKVVGAVTVARDDDPVSQRHELIGAKTLYQHFDDCGINVNTHGHDRNASLNKYLDVEQPSVTNANDTWHAVKGVAKILKSVTSGPKKMHGVTWHNQLSDKAASVKTHCYYAMRHCEKSVEKLHTLLDNVVQHYKNVHDHCLPSSRCRTDENYEPSKVIINDSDAEKILLRAIHGLQIYKNAKDYVHCIDTHYVESFSNAALVYHDKRISFGHKEYQRRTNMAVLDWNQNVDRDFTSITWFEDPCKPRKRSGHKNLTPKSYKHLETL